MRGELAALGLTSSWKVLLAARNFVRTVWDPTRSDVQHGINTLVYEALAAPLGDGSIHELRIKTRGLA